MLLIKNVIKLTQMLYRERYRQLMPFNIKHKRFVCSIPHILKVRPFAAINSYFPFFLLNLLVYVSPLAASICGVKNVWRTNHQV